MKIFPKFTSAFVLTAITLIAVIFVNPYNTKAATIGVPTDFLSISKGLVGWWTFDGNDMVSNIRDRSGNNNNGALNGATTTVIGKVGQALSFNGVNNRVNLGNPAALQIVSAGTISIWIKSTTPCGYPILAANFDWDVDTNGYGFAVFNDCVDNIALMIADGSAYNSTAAGAGSFDGKWHLITGTWDGANISMYRDGVSISSAPQTITPVTNINNFVIGGNAAGNYPVQGALDDMRIYNRALSATEIKQLYNISSASHSVTLADPLKSGLIGWWTMDGKDMLQNVKDVSGQGNTGRLIGATTTVSGKIGQALSFNGSTNYVDTSNFADSLSNFTVSTWFKAPSSVVQPNCGGQIISKVSSGGASSGNGWMMALGGGGCGISSDRVYAMVQSGSGNEWVNKYTTATYNDGKWHHAVMVFSGGNTMTLYVDGSTSGMTDYTSGTLGSYSNSSNVRIGNNYDNELFNGSIDDTRIYGRALSAAEIRQLYNASLSNISVSPTDSLKNGLVAWWTMDGKDVNWATGRVNDLSGNGNTANMSGLATATAPVSGKVGQAFKFSRTNYFSAPDSASTRVNGDLSVSSWVKISAYNTNGSTADPIVYAGTNGGCFHSWTLNVGMDSRFWMTIEPGNCDYTQGTVKDTGVFTLNRWYNVASTYNVTSGNLILYINGVQVDQRTVTGRYNSDAGISVGADPAFQSWNEGVNGIIDDVRVYNRVLSANEMKQIYNSGR